MPYQSQIQTIPFGESHTFPFSEVSQYVLGISWFSMVFSGEENAGPYSTTTLAVQDMGIALSHNLTSQGVTVNVNGTLLSHDCNRFNPAKSSVTVVILAWIGDGDSAMTLTNANNISNVPISISASPQVNLAFLSGFGFSFGGRSEYLETIKISIVNQSYNPSSKTVTPAVSAQMSGGGKDAVCVGDCGLFAVADANVRATSYHSIESGTTQPFSAPGGDSGQYKYVAFMTGFECKRPGIVLCSIEAGIAVDRQNGSASFQASTTGYTMGHNGVGDNAVPVKYDQKSPGNVSGVTIRY